MDGGWYKRGPGGGASVEGASGGVFHQDDAGDVEVLGGEAVDFADLSAREAEGAVYGVLHDPDIVISERISAGVRRKLAGLYSGTRCISF